jgi:hypothetical protein
MSGASPTGRSMPSNAFSPAPAVVSRRSDREVEKMSTPHLLDLRSIARTLGGEISGRSLAQGGPDEGDVQAAEAARSRCIIC